MNNNDPALNKLLSSLNSLKGQIQDIQNAFTELKKSGLINENSIDKWIEEIKNINKVITKMDEEINKGEDLNGGS